MIIFHDKGSPDIEFARHVFVFPVLTKKILVPLMMVSLCNFVQSDLPSTDEVNVIINSEHITVLKGERRKDRVCLHCCFNMDRALWFQYEISNFSIT